MKESDRNCYCVQWERNPAPLEREGIPRGFCGLCERCGRPGHTRHHPGAPSTGTWCNHHYRILVVFHPMSRIGFFVWLCALAALGIALWKWLG